MACHARPWSEQNDWGCEVTRLRTAGFTLLEMLIAVVIIAVVGTTLSTAIGGVAGQTYSLERRTLANWISQDQLPRLRLDLRINPRPLPEGNTKTRLTMGARDWEVETVITATDLPLLRRVEVEVFEYQDGTRKGPYDRLVAFLGQH